MRRRRGSDIGSVIFDRSLLEKCRRIPKIEHKISNSNNNNNNDNDNDNDNHNHNNNNNNKNNNKIRLKIEEPWPGLSILKIYKRSLAIWS